MSASIARPGDTPARDENGYVAFCKSEAVRAKCILDRRRAVLAGEALRESVEPRIAPRLNDTTRQRLTGQPSGPTIQTSADLADLLTGVDFEVASEPRACAPALHDGPCDDCKRHYPAWRAEHDTWNAVMGGPGATDDPGGLLCPTCFLTRADGVSDVAVWLVAADWSPS